MANHLYRKVAFCAILLTLSTPHFAQTSRMKARNGPRAIGVLEVDDKNRSRLVPVTLIYETRFFDANLYQANPVPMALLPETQYDVLQSNERVGAFTTRGSREAREAWYGLGVWKSKEEEAKAKPADEDERPILRRPKSSTGSKPAAVTAAAPSPTPSEAPIEDPDRPTLRHTKSNENPSAGQKAITELMMTPLRGAAAPQSIKPAPNNKVKEYIAVSDAQATDYRSMAFNMKPEEEATYRDKMLGLVRPELVEYAKSKNLKLPPNFRVTDYQMRAFDADYSNNPQLVMSVSYLPPTAEGTRPTILYATVVARIDYNGDAQKVFSQVTDSTRMDMASRLELIDIIDAEGYERGSLLFRQYTDTGRSFVLYRVETFGLTKLFEGSSGE